jgi:hypothetical protein
MVLIHTLIDPPGADDDRESGFGVVAADLQPKSAYCSLGAEWDRPAC